jgi:hypothetical protein
MRVGWEERGGAVAETLERLDPKPRALDRARRVARQVTTTRETGPEGRIGEPLQASLPSGMGEHMLVEAQLPTGTDHPVELPERRLLIGHRAEHKRNNASIEGFRLPGEVIGGAARDGDRDGGPRRGALGSA